MSLEANSSQEQQDKQKTFIERARRGVLEFMARKTAPVPMGELHDFTFQKFFLQHQGFSRLMEGLVADGLVGFSYETDSFFLTEQGQAQASQS